MDIRPTIIKLAVDADFRNKMLKFFPNILDGYLVTPQGEVLTREQAKYLDVFNYYLDGLNFISSKV